MKNKTLFLVIFCFLFITSGSVFAQLGITADIVPESCLEAADGSISLIFSDQEEGDRCVQVFALQSPLMPRLSKRGLCDSLSHVQVGDAVSDRCNR